MGQVFRDICKRKLELNFSSSSGSGGRYFKALADFISYEPPNSRKKGRSRGRKKRFSDDEDRSDDGSGRGSRDGRAQLLNMSKLEAFLSLKNEESPNRGGENCRMRNAFPRDSDRAL